MLAIFLLVAVTNTLALYLLPKRWLFPIIISEIVALAQSPPEVQLVGAGIVILQYLNFRRGTLSSAGSRRSPLLKALNDNPVATLTALAGKSPRGALVSLSGTLPQMFAFAPQLQAVISTNPVGQMEKLILESGQADRLRAVFDMQPGEIDLISALVLEELTKKGSKALQVMSLVMAGCLFLFTMLPVPVLAMLKLSTLLK